MHDKDAFLASKKVVEFISKYTELMEQQLQGVRGAMQATVEEVMKNIHEISNKAEKKRDEANAILAKTYLEPDQETTHLVNNIQSSVDSVFKVLEQKNSKGLDPFKEVVVSDNADQEKNMMRMGGKFSKHMEAMSTMENELKDVLFNMMGALSTDDVVGQRLEHISLAIHALRVGLSYLLINFHERLTVADVDQFMSDLLAYTYKQYTMETEKELFKKTFGSIPQKKKAA